MKWQILVPTIPHRHDKLLRLIRAIAEQRGPVADMAVLVHRDNLELGYTAKCQALLDAATADYVSFIDDDDLPGPDYVPRILDALEGDPDYVGFHVDYSVDGVYQCRFTHSLIYSDWGDDRTRDISHLNPIRREIAVKGRFEGPDQGSDSNWASQIRESGLCSSEFMIDAPMYLYLFSTADCCTTPREPWTMAMPALPEYSWLELL